MKNLFDQRILLRNSQGVQLALKADLIYLKAQGSYTDYYLLKNGAIKRVRQSKHLAWHANRLDDRFERINPKIVVNMNHVEFIYHNRILVLSAPVNEKFIITQAYWKKFKSLMD